jgi:hypothetical protein
LEKINGILKNEDGMVVVLALLVLVLLTIFSVSATNTSNTELSIAGAERIYQQNFYEAEGAGIEAVELMESLANPNQGSPPWLMPVPDVVTNDNIYDAAFWQAGGSITPMDSTLADFIEETQFMVVGEGTIGSLDATSSKMHEYSVYGRSVGPRGGFAIVHIGYVKAF